MANLNRWKKLADGLAGAPPLRFVHGMRHSVHDGFASGSHWHHEIEIVYHPTGRGFVRAEGEADMPFSEGDVIVHAARQSHDQVMHSAGEDYCVQIALPPALKKIPKQALHVPALDDPSLIDELRVLSEGRVHPDRAMQTIFNLRATSALCALIHRASARQAVRGSRRDYVAAAEQFIRENFAGIRSLREVAEQAGIGYDHLRHLFKARRGQSLVQYLNEVRLERAKTLLVHSRLPLKQIASMCGFRDEYYFSSVFRRQVRLPPGRYRERMGANV